MIKIDSVNSLRMFEKKGWFDVLHYFPIVSETRYEQKFSYRKVGKKYQRYQKVLFHREYRCPQWKNLRNDIKAFFRIPKLEWSLRYAIGMFALWLYAKKGIGLPLFMGAVAFDAVGSSFLTTGTSVSYTHTPVGTPTAVVAFTSFSGGSDPFVEANFTYGGATLTWPAGASNVANWFCHTGYKLSPASGAQTVSNSWTGSRFSWTATATYTGTDTTGIGNTANAYVGTGTDISVSFTPSFNNSMVVGGITTFNDPLGSITPKTGQTDRVTHNDTNGGTTIGDNLRTDTTAFPFGDDFASSNRAVTVCALELKVAVSTIFPELFFRHHIIGRKVSVKNY